MTNEEIEKQLGDAVLAFELSRASYAPAELGDHLLEAVRSLVSQAYEEAAQIVSRGEDCRAADHLHGLCGCAANVAAIRALKDSLALEPVS